MIDGITEDTGMFWQTLHLHNELTAEATSLAKFLNSGEDAFESAGVKVCCILNSNMTFDFACGAGVVPACDAQWIETNSL